MKIIMIHVGQWLNLNPFRDGDRAGAKPPLWQDFLSALGSDTPCIQLERRILDFVRERYTDFTQTSLYSFLEIYPEHAVDTYAERFAHDV